MPKHLRVPSAFDLEVLERTLWGEARSEGFVGMRAVAEVILNRARDGRWPDSLAEVCMQPLQFSCWNKGDRNHSPMMAVDLSDAAFFLARSAAAYALSDDKDPTLGANHYFTRSLVGTRNQPSWYDEAKITTGVGAHIFLKL